MKRILDVFKKDKIEFITDIKCANLELLYPPIFQNKKIGSWFKKSKERYNHAVKKSKCPFNPSRVSEIYKCPGIFGISTSGYSIRNFADLSIDLPLNPKSFNDIKYEFGAGLTRDTYKEITRLSYHNKDQFPEIFENDRIYPYIIKIITPWTVKCPPNTAFYMIPDYYSDNLWFESTPGVLDPSIEGKIIINLQIFKKEGRVILPKGITLAKLIPFQKNKKYKTVIREMNENEKRWESEKDLVWFSSFNRDYSSIKKDINIIKNK
jgi:hypothetical protein